MALIVTKIKSQRSIRVRVRRGSGFAITARRGTASTRLRCAAAGRALAVRVSSFHANQIAAISVVVIAIAVAVTATGVCSASVRAPRFGRPGFWKYEIVSTPQLFARKATEVATAIQRHAGRAAASAIVSGIAGKRYRSCTRVGRTKNAMARMATAVTVRVAVSRRTYRIATSTAAAIAALPIATPGMPIKGRGSTSDAHPFVSTTDRPATEMSAQGFHALTERYG